MFTVKRLWTVSDIVPGTASFLSGISYYSLVVLVLLFSFFLFMSLFSCKISVFYLTLL